MIDHAICDGCGDMGKESWIGKWHTDCPKDGSFVRYTTALGYRLGKMSAPCQDLIDALTAPLTKPCDPPPAFTPACIPAMPTVQLWPKPEPGVTYTLTMTPIAPLYQPCEEVLL